MNAERFKGNWNILKGKVKEKWGELTDDEVDQVDGQVEQLVGAIQKHYGKTREEAEREVAQWRSFSNC